MARKARSAEGIKRSVLFQQDAWRNSRRLAQARAKVSGFGSLVGVFFAVSFACFALISHRPWFVFAGLSVLSLIIAWQSIISAERHLASVPMQWKIKAVPPFNVRVTHKVAATGKLPETSVLIVDRTLAKFAQLLMATQVQASPPARAALDDLTRIAEDAVMGTLWDAPRIGSVLQAARARPRDLGIQMSAKSQRHRFQLTSLAIEGVTGDLLAAVGGGAGIDTDAIRKVGRNLAYRLSEPVEGYPKQEADADAAAEEVEARAPSEQRTLTGRTAAKATASEAATKTTADEAFIA